MLFIPFSFLFIFWHPSFIPLSSNLFNYCCAGILEYRLGIQEYKNILEYWNSGIQECWNTLILEYWNTGIYTDTKMLKFYIICFELHKKKIKREWNWEEMVRSKDFIHCCQNIKFLKFEYLFYNRVGSRNILAAVSLQDLSSSIFVRSGNIKVILSHSSIFIQWWQCPIHNDTLNTFDRSRFWTYSQ